jgi:hypothetical protein
MLEKLLSRFRLTRQPTLKLYRGSAAPLAWWCRATLSGKAHWRAATSGELWANAWGLLRLFLVRPWADVPVRVTVAGQTAGARTDADGFFRLELALPAPLPAGWHPALAELLDPSSGARLAHATAEVHIAYETPYAFILRHRRHLSGVALGHALAAAVGAAEPQRPQPRRFCRRGRPLPVAGPGRPRHARPPQCVFLREQQRVEPLRLISEFADLNRMPKGVFQLSQLKRLSQTARTGQNKHATKLDRIARILAACPASSSCCSATTRSKTPASTRQSEAVSPPNPGGVHPAGARRRPGRSKGRVG